MTFLDLVRDSNENTRKMLRETLALLKYVGTVASSGLSLTASSDRTAENTSAAARNAIRLLEGLFAAEEELRSTSSSLSHKKKKRKVDDGTATPSNDPADTFSRVVNRLLVCFVLV